MAEKSNKKTLHRTVVKVVILSEEEYDGNPSLEQIAYDIDQGDCVGNVTVEKKTTLTGKRAADEVSKFRSDPEFFRMDADGDELED